MTEAEKRMHRISFTGHRPEKLTRPDRAIKKDLEKEIRQAVADGLNVFITGMARGVDIWAEVQQPEMVIQTPPSPGIGHLPQLVSPRLQRP